MANYVAIRLYDKDGKIAVPQDCWPVGSIYISINNVNPTNYFGGTWVAFGTGRTLVGVDSNQNEFNSVEKTGGAKTHTLTIDEMPKHAHRTWIPDTNYSEKGDGYDNYYYGAGRNYILTTYQGGDSPHNNLQPYITCYMWKRTA